MSKLSASDLYKAALADQKQYDKISTIIVGAGLALPYFTFITYKSIISMPFAPAVFLFSIVITLILCSWYASMSNWARTARSVSAHLEFEYSPKRLDDNPTRGLNGLGISSAYKHWIDINLFECSNTHSFPFRYKVYTIFILMAFGYFIVFTWLIWKRLCWIPLPV